MNLHYSEHGRYKIVEYYNRTADYHYWRVYEKQAGIADYASLALARAAVRRFQKADERRTRYDVFAMKNKRKP